MNPLKLEFGELKTHGGWANSENMYQNAPCLRYADAFRQIYQARVVEREKEALDASLVDSLSNASKLSELIDVWRMIGSGCRAGRVPAESRVPPELPDPAELRDYGEDYKRLAEMPLKDMMKAILK